ncbi:MAG: rhodanese-like domain-containing protein [Campylobacterota bacterium]|nr:rhodanese-like domain-containing protein [Campylobacterota bacterium]
MKKIILAVLFAASSLMASEFIDYKKLSKALKAEHVKAGTFASADDVKAALKAKDWVVADVRTAIEWSAAHIPGSQRIGRQAPEKALENIVLDDDDNFIKDNIIIVCNSAARASIESDTYGKMGFKTVKIYDIYSWIDECNEVKTGYSSKKDKKGTKNKFGMFKAAHCK